MKEKMELLGKIGYVKLFNDEMRIKVTIIDYKFTWGHDRWLVKPLSGSGEAWVENVEMQ